MTSKREILEAVSTRPLELRQLLHESEVVAALSSIGILPRVLELHAPSVKSRNQAGLGETLCGIRGTRHKDVTCARCRRARGDQTR